MIDPTKITSIDPPPGGEHLNIMISACGTKLWVCIDGAAVFRYRGLKRITLDAPYGREINQMPPKSLDQDEKPVNGIPMLAVRNSQLGEKLHDTIECPHCGVEHNIENSGPSTTIDIDGTVSQGPAGLLQFYKCGKETYLAGIEGKALPVRRST